MKLKSKLSFKDNFISVFGRICFLNILFRCIMMIGSGVMMTEKDVFERIKRKLENNSRFWYVPNKLDSFHKKESGFIWIGAREGVIGTDKCHYEFIFNKEDELSVEVHFSEKKATPYFENLQKPDKGLVFKKWRSDKGFRKLVLNNCGIQISKNNNDVESIAVNQLKKIDDMIGIELVEILKRHPELLPQNIINIISDKNGSITSETRKFSKEISVRSKEEYTCPHHQVEDDLIKALQRKYNDQNGEKNIVRWERNIGNGIPDVFVSFKGKYDLYEVKPYENPIDCIKEAFGQLLFYSLEFSKMNFTVNKLYIIGPNSADQNSLEFIKHIRNTLSIKNISYLSPPEI